MGDYLVKPYLKNQNKQKTNKCFFLKKKQDKV